MKPPLRLAKKVNSIPKVRQKKSNFWDAIHFSIALI